MTGDRSTEAAAAGVLLGTFAADAVCGRWEGHAAVDLPNARARLEASLTADELRYTDDTQLTLALAEHLCVHPDVEPSALAATFLEHFEHWRGYARGMHGIVAAWRDGVPPEDAARAVFPDGSFGNGAAMRVAPIGVVHAGDTDAITAAAHRQARLTHAHPIGMDAAAVQAHAVAFAVQRGVFAATELDELQHLCGTEELRITLRIAAQQLTRWLDADAPTAAAIGATIGTGVLAQHSVASALWVAAAAENVEEAVVLALAMGGDIDTIAAMACAVLGAVGGEAAVPKAWIDRLEDGRRGQQYARDLARRLAAVS